MDEGAQVFRAIVTRQFVCPVCGRAFYNYAIRRTKIRLVKSDIDLRNYYEPIDPLYYEIIFCNYCGYAADVMFFSKLPGYKKTLITEGITKSFKPIILDLPYTPSNVPPLFEHALSNAFAKKAKNGEIAYLHLKIAWLYRDLGDLANEKRELALAAKYFEQAYIEEDFPICTMDNLTFRYLVGAIHCLLGNDTEALRWIAEVVVAQHIPGRLKNRAINLKNEIRDKSVENKTGKI